MSTKRDRTGGQDAVVERSPANVHAEGHWQLCFDWVPLSDHSVKSNCYERQYGVYVKGQALHEANGPRTAH